MEGNSYALRTSIHIIRGLAFPSAGLPTYPCPPPATPVGRTMGNLCRNIFPTTVSKSYSWHTMLIGSSVLSTSFN